MTYTMWDRTEDDEMSMSQQALEKILSETDGTWTEPFGGMGSKIDFVIYEETEVDGEISVAAVHVAPEIRGHWYTIPDSQSAFIGHELSQNAYERD